MFSSAVHVPLKTSVDTVKLPVATASVTNVVGTTPVAPASVSTSIVSPTAVTVRWPQVTDATGYRVERSAGSGQFSIIANVGADARSYADTGLTTGTTYRYRVLGTNTAGVGTASPVSTVIPAVSSNLAAPTNLASTQPLPNKVRLTWSGTNSSVAVVIQRSLDGGLNWSDLVTLPGSTQTYTDTVQRTTLYSYRLQAKTFTATSSITGSISLMTPPDDVASLLRTSITSTSTRLNWSSTTGATGFVIEQSKEGGPYEIVATPGGGATNTTIEDLETGTDYSYRIYATNAGGASNKTTLVGVLTLAARPTDLTLSAAEENATSIDISFTGVKGADKYVIERQSEGRQWGTLVELPPSTTTYTDILVTTGEVYDYRVKAVNESGDSQYSEQASILLSAAGAISSPAQLGYTAGAKSPVLSWEPRGLADSFEVQRLVGKNWKTFIATTATTATLPAVKAGAPLRVRVLAVRGGIDGAPSEDITVMVVPPVVTSIKRLTSPGTTISLTWKAPAGANKYRIERSANGTEWTTLVESSSVAAYIDETNVAGVSYQYRVTAGNDAGYGPTSTPFTVTVAPGTPTGLSALSTGKTIQVSWTDVSGETGYRVLASTDGVKWSTAATTKTNTTTAAIKNTKFSTFRVVAFNKAGTSPQSAPATKTSSIQASSLSQTPTQNLSPTRQLLKDNPLN